MSRFLAVLSLLGAVHAHAQSAVSVVNGRLSVSTPSGDQNIKFLVGPAAGQTAVFGVPGLPDGAAYTGITAIDLVTGTGFDKVEFDINAPQSLAISAHTGAGQAETKIQWKVPPGTPEANAIVHLASATGATKTELDFVSEAVNTTFDWTMAGGAGNKEVKGGIDFKTGGSSGAATIAFDLGFGRHTAVFEIESEVPGTSIGIDSGPNVHESITKILADKPSDLLTIVHHSQAPKTVLEAVSDAAVVDLNVTGLHTSLSSEIKYAFKQLRPAVISAFYEVETSPAQDKIESFIEAPGSTVVLDGAVNTGEGNDFVNFFSDAGSTVVGLDLTGGAGDDYLSIALKGWYQNSQTIGPVIHGGTGNDILILRTETGIRGTGLPNDVPSVIDGGPGFDRFNAFGIILNCEQRL